MLVFSYLSPQQAPNRAAYSVYVFLSSGDRLAFLTYDCFRTQKPGRVVKSVCTKSMLWQITIAHLFNVQV
jgi:hypothetical protein